MYTMHGCPLCFHMCCLCLQLCVFLCVFRLWLELVLQPHCGGHQCNRGGVALAGQSASAGCSHLWGRANLQTVGCVCCPLFLWRQVGAGREKRKWWLRSKNVLWRQNSFLGFFIGSFSSTEDVYFLWFLLSEFWHLSVLLNFVFLSHFIDIQSCCCVVAAWCLNVTACLTQSQCIYIFIFTYLS